jgi:hypothetical protein
VSFAVGREGNVTLYEGDRSDEYQAYYQWELAIHVPDGTGRRELLVDAATFDRLPTGRRAVLDDARLPVVIEIGDWMDNAQPVPAQLPVAAGWPEADGVALMRRERTPEAEANHPGCIAVVRDRQGQELARAVLWDLARAPWVVTAAGGPLGLELRRQRRDLGFTIHLDDFEHRFHPNTQKAAFFASEVTVDFGDGDVRKQRIVMNQPLRRHGLVVYQSSWGPQDAPAGTPLFSGFAVVFNPADQWPLWACLIIALGMVVHFLAALTRFVQRQGRNSGSETAP